MNQKYYDRINAYNKKSYEREKINKRESMQRVDEIMRESLPYTENGKRSVPKKWNKLFSYKYFAAKLFQVFQDKILITDKDIFNFFRMKGYFVNEETDYFFMVQYAKGIDDMEKIKSRIKKTNEVENVK